jgi:HAD superfamily hydrolase (TIGR01509 family)
MAPANVRPTAPIRGVLFDLDGTLVDHFVTLYRCYKFTLEQLGLPVPEFEVVRRTVGGSMQVTMRSFVPPEHMDAAVKIWREHFDRIYLDDVRLLPGAHDLVERLHARGLRLAVLTNKIGEHSRGICRHLGLEPMLAFVIGAGDTPYRKPQREFVEAALARLGTSAAETILVGDSPYDIECAHAAGVRVPCVTTGTHTAEELAAAGADGVYSNLTELGAAVFEPG